MKTLINYKGCQYILLILFTLFSQLCFAEEAQNNPLDISIGTIKTEAEQAAVGVLVKYVEKIDENYLLVNADPKNSSAGTGWLFDISPEVEMQLGENDAFNGIIAKVTGNYIRFDTKDIGGFITPCSDCLFHVIPVSIGLESNRNFENVSGLIEVGYVPFYLNNKSIFKLGLKTKVGIFLQGGYKFEADNNTPPNEGRAIDESEEEPDSEIARIKFDAGTNIELFKYSKDKQNIQLIPRIRLWYDMINAETYHKYEAILRFTLGEDRSFDLKYEDGSGAPNFNEGEQFSANISFKY